MLLGLGGTCRRLFRQKKTMTAMPMTKMTPATAPPMAAPRLLEFLETSWVEAASETVDVGSVAADTEVVLVTLGTVDVGLSIVDTEVMVVTSGIVEVGLITVDTGVVVAAQIDPSCGIAAKYVRMPSASNGTHMTLVPSLTQLMLYGVVQVVEASWHDDDEQHNWLPKTPFARTDAGVIPSWERELGAGLLMPSSSSTFPHDRI
jgi:hypothetical protein